MQQYFVRGHKFLAAITNEDDRCVPHHTQKTKCTTMECATPGPKEQNLKTVKSYDEAQQMEPQQSSTQAT
jgi:hypothetical protein